jgi:hypothetical protein
MCCITFASAFIFSFSRFLVLAFPVNVLGDVTRMWMVFPMLSGNHFFISLLTSLINDVDGVISLVGFNHSSQHTLVHQKKRLRDALTVLAHPEEYQEEWERLNLLAERHNEGPRLDFARRFAQSRLVNVCHLRTSSPSACSAIHLHLQDARSEIEAWQMPIGPQLDGYSCSTVTMVISR